MKEMEERLAFIDMRADGMSLAKIADKLGVCRQTLARWKKEHETEIWRVRSWKLDALEEEYGMKRQGRIELLGTLLRRVKEELERRDLSDIPTVKLFELDRKLSAELQKLFGATRIFSIEEVDRASFMQKVAEDHDTSYTPDPPNPLRFVDESDGDDADGHWEWRAGSN